MKVGYPFQVKQRWAWPPSYEPVLSHLLLKLVSGDLIPQQALYLLLCPVFHVKIHTKLFTAGFKDFIVVCKLPVIGIKMRAVIFPD